MSDSESDIGFESADEGEELQNSGKLNVERPHASYKTHNAETEKNYKICEKERTENSCTNETNVCNITMTINFKNPGGDSDSNRTISNKNDKEFKIIHDSNRETDQFGIGNDDGGEGLKSKYTEDTYINEKQVEVSEKILIEDNKKELEHLLKSNKTESSETSFNDDKQFQLTVESKNDNKKEKPGRVMLKLEKKLAAKSMHNSVADLEQNEELPVVNALSSESKEKTSSWGWGSWRSSLLSTAACSVSAFTSQVSEGLGAVLGTVESTLGAPPPEELALAIESKQKEINNQTKVNETEASVHDQEHSSGIFDGVTSLSKAIENTGSKVLMTGLDTLELIGKTTIDILTEGDPGLRKKRAYFTEGTNLSEILREAKDKAEGPESVTTLESKVKETIHYSTLFDNFQGIAHLEALELLSKQNKIVLQGLLLSKAGEDMEEYREIINELQLICEDLPPADDTLDEESHHEFQHLIMDCTSKLELDLNIAKLEELHKNIHGWLTKCEKEQDKGETKDATELYNEALKSMAQLTARSMELFHKVGEMILCKSPDTIPALSCAKLLTEITGVLCFEVGIIASKFCRCLNTTADDSEDPDSVTPIITNVYLEASNSNTYIQDAFQLLVPILQVVAIKQTE